MKYCDQYALALSAFVDGELSEEEKTEVLAHTKVCEGCRELLAELMAMHAVLGGMEEYDAPAGFAEGVMECLHEQAAPKKRTHGRKWMGIAACAAVVIMAAAILPRMGGVADSTAECNEAKMGIAQEPAEEFTDAYSSVQHEGMMLCGTAALPPETEAADEDSTHAVFYALSDDAETFLVERGMGDQVYEANDTICSYLVPVELLHEMAQQGLLTETGTEEAAPDDITEGSVIVVVRMAEGVQP